MSKKLGFVLLGLLAVMSGTCWAGTVLWYEQPANEWEEALPIGNGHLGAMVYGGMPTEHVQFNEATFWSGGPHDESNPDSFAALPEIRKLIFEGKYKEAHELTNAKMMGKPKTSMAYQPVGDFYLDFEGQKDLKNYRRQLDLQTGITAVRYEVNGVKYLREVFVSPVDRLLVMRITANKPKSINFTARMGSIQKKSKVSVDAQGRLNLSCTAPDHARIKGATKVESRLVLHKVDGGNVSTEGDTLKVQHATSVTLLLTVETSYVDFQDVSADAIMRVEARLKKAKNRTFDQMKTDQIAAHRKFFDRVVLDLGTTPSAKLPTDVRLKKFAADKEKTSDPDLAALYFQFGRYLMITSSAPDGVPPNLQGVWNDQLKAPWKSNYTIDMNLQMVYWPVETLNLSECRNPLFGYLEGFAVTGKKIAKIHWGAKKGWVAHHNSDIWCTAAPHDGATWGIWPTGGAWLATGIWEHYLYTQDKEFLRRMYPVLKGCAEFFTETLVEYPGKDWLVTCPSISPENRHLKGNISICAGPSMDNQLIRDIFTQCADTADLLGVDPDFAKQLRTMKKKLPPNQIGAGGYLQEWLDDWDMKVPNKHHRHISHLYAVYPGAQITTQTPKFLNAAIKSLDLRGNGTTSWSKAWYANCRARFHQPERAYAIFADLLSVQTFPNLFDAYKKQSKKGPPKPLRWQTFQIDGNFGAPAAIAEMLMQSHIQNSDGTFEIELLPALPKAWSTGKVTGLRARGGFEVDIEWKDGKLTSAKITSRKGKKTTVVYGKKKKNVILKDGESVQFNGQLGKK